MQNQMTQKVNFYVAIGFIASFGIFMTVTIVQSFNKNAFIVKYMSSPIVLDYEIDGY